MLPYAENISAALESAQLRPDLSQELSGVYVSRNPLAYPISAYSYIVSQCAPAGDRPTCKGNYTNRENETLADFLDLIACDGQANAAEMGYSPLPPHLSQEIVNSIGRMNGTAPPRRLNAQNCPGNPRFRGSLGGGAASPEDPLEDIPEQNGGGGGGGGAGGNGSGDGVGGGNGGGTDTSAGSGTTATSEPSAGAGRDGGADAVGGGSGDWRDAEPTSYDGDRPEPLDRAPLVILLGMLACPPLFTTLWRRLHERPTPGSPPPPAPPPDPRAAPSG